MTATDVQDRVPNKIYAPWSIEVVAALNHYQQQGEFHPFTCGRGAGGSHVAGVSLVATAAGWYCPFGDCDYAQDWAWTFMARGNHSDR